MALRLDCGQGGELRVEENTAADLVIWILIAHHKMTAPPGFPSWLAGFLDDGVLTAS